jgi:hypothetical protein
VPHAARSLTNKRRQSNAVSAALKHGSAQTNNIAFSSNSVRKSRAAPREPCTPSRSISLA